MLEDAIYFMKNFDAFKRLPEELTIQTKKGGIVTLCMYLFMFYIFFCETTEYLRGAPKTDIVISRELEKQLEIGFDITMHNMDCAFVDISVTDPLGDMEYDLSDRYFNKTVIDHLGEPVKTYNAADFDPEKFKDMQYQPQFDYGKSGENLEKLIDSNDFVFVYFFGDWEQALNQKAAAGFKNFEDQLEDMKFKDIYDKSVDIKMHSVDCGKNAIECTTQSVAHIPVFRLYKRDKTFKEYEGFRYDTHKFRQFIQEALKETQPFEETIETSTQGCRLNGIIKTKRAPGTFKIGVSDKNSATGLLPALVNVSHTVHTFMFREPETRVPSDREILKYGSQDIIDHLDTLGESSFITSEPHESLQHFAQAVSTTLQPGTYENSRYDLRLFQYTYQYHPKKEGTVAIPTVQFSYTISPMALKHRIQYRHLANYLTETAAFIGGIFCMGQFAHSVLMLQAQNFGSRSMLG